MGKNPILPTIVTFIIFFVITYILTISGNINLKSIRGGTSGGGTSGEEVTLSNFSVTINSISSITINFIIIGNIPSTITINIYSDSSLNNVIASVNVRENINSIFSYNWENISNLFYDTTYYIRASSSDGNDTSVLVLRIPSNTDILNSCRSPIAFTVLQEPSKKDQIMKSILTEMIPMFAAGIASDFVFSRSIGIVAGSIQGTYTYIDTYLKNQQSLKIKISERVELGLMKTDRLYKMAKLFHLLSPAQVARLGVSLTDYLKNLQKTNPKQYKIVIKQIDDTIKIVGGRTIGQIARAAASKAATDAALSTLKLVSRNMSTFLNTIGIIGIITDIEDIACSLNPNNGVFSCPKWSDIDSSKTSDFLKLREDYIVQTINDYDDIWRKETGSSGTPPTPTNFNNIYLNLIGPLSKIKPNVKKAEIMDAMYRLLIIGNTIQNDEYLRAVSEAFVNNNKTGSVESVEEIPQIQIIRRIQGKIAEPFVKSMKCVSKNTCKRSIFMGQGLNEGTFDVRNTYTSIVNTNNPITLLEYKITNGVDFAPGSTFMFSNPGIPIDEDFYVRFNGQHIAFIIGNITCSATSPAIFAGYFIDNKGIEIPVPSFGGPITSLEVGILNEPKPISPVSPKTCSNSTIPDGPCIANAFTRMIEINLNDSDFDDLFKIANEYVCYKYNGKYIKTNNQCSYKTSTACYNSYKWPDIIEVNNEISPKVTFIINTDPNVGNIFDNIKLSNQLLVHKKDLFVLTSTNIFRYINFYDKIIRQGDSYHEAPQIFFTGTSLTCFTIYDDTMYICESSGGKVIKITNFYDSTPQINSNFMILTRNPISIAVPKTDFILIAYSDKISKIKDDGLNGRVVTEKFISTDGVRNVTISNPLYMICKSSYIFVLNNGGVKISRISYDDYTDVQENWYTTSSSSPPNIIMRYMFISEEYDELNLYVTTNSNILKIGNCTSSSQNITQNYMDDIKNRIDEQLVDFEDEFQIKLPYLSFNGNASSLLNKIDNITNNLKYIFRCNNTLVYTRINESNIYGFYNELSWDENFPATEPFKQEQYAEWRTNYDHLKRDLVTDFTNDPSAEGGVCVAWNYGHRMQCSEFTSDGKTNRYNPDTGECINTEKFCHSYGVPFERRVSIDRLGRKEQGFNEGVDRASGPLDSCVIPLSYKVLDYTFVSRNLIQPLVAIGYTMGSYAFRLNVGKMGFATLNGIFNFGRPLSSVNLNNPEQMAGILQAASQGSSDAYRTIMTSTLDNIIQRMEEKDRKNRCRCVYDDGPWTNYIERPPAAAFFGDPIGVGACLHKNADPKKLSFRKGDGACPDGYYRNTTAKGIDAWCEAAIEYKIDEACGQRFHRLANRQAFDGGTNISVGNYKESIGDYCLRTVSPKPWRSCGRPDLPGSWTSQQIIDIALDKPNATTDRPNLDPAVLNAEKSGIPPESINSSRYMCSYSGPRDTVGDRIGVRTRGINWDSKCDVEAARLDAINKMSKTNDERITFAEECRIQNDPTCMPIASYYTKVTNYDFGGSDIRSMTIPVGGNTDDCKAACENDSTNCKGFVFIPSSRTCFLKTNMTGLYHWDDRESYVKGRTYYTKLTNKDINGYDIGSARTSLNDCKTDCDTDPNCKGIVNIPGGQCFKKSTITNMINQTGKDFYVKQPATGRGKFDIYNRGLKKCVKPFSSIVQNGTYAVLDGSCNQSSTLFEMTASGSIKHVESGKCVHPLNGNAVEGVELVLHDGCDENRLAFDVTSAGSLRHRQTKLCVHNQNQGTSDGTKLVLSAECDNAQRLLYDTVTKTF